jgi:hypothetical protein
VGKPVKDFIPTASILESNQLFVHHCWVLADLSAV